MKFDTSRIKGSYMLAIIFTLLISCATMTKTHREAPVPFIGTPAVMSGGIPYIPIKKDTITQARRDQIEYRKKINAFMDRMEAKANETYSDVHSVRDLNVLLQTQLLDLTSRLSIRRDQIDSLNYRLRSIQDTINLTKSQASTYYRQAIKASYYQEQNKKYINSIDWSTYIGFGFILLVGLVNNYMIFKIRKGQKRLLYD